MRAKPTRVILRQLGLVDYQSSWQAMRQFTTGRTPSTPDEIWLLQHPPVYTLGLSGKQTITENPDNIPLLHTDRGGQITYHGPGQVLAYVLIDLRRRGWGAKQLVTTLEQAVTDLLADQGVVSHRQPGAPGVYVNGRKIAALGLRIRHGCSYHGISFNVDMDLEPFHWIDPCGYPGLEVTQLADFVVTAEPKSTGRLLVKHLVARLEYNAVQTLPTEQELAHHG